MAKDKTKQDQEEVIVEAEIQEISVEEAAAVDPAFEEKAEAPAKKAGTKARRAKKEADETVEKAEAIKNKRKQPQKPPRSRLERRGKQYRKVYEAIEPGKAYPLAEAIELLGKTSYVKFDASVELHANLGVDPKQADQQVRGTVSLPHGSGKAQTVAVLAEEAVHAAAAKAGADVVGEADLLEEIGKGNFNFDILVATPAMMPQLGRHAKVLGPKGLMPSPKSGTVTNEVAKIVKELKSGRVEFRIDRHGIVHLGFGKVSFSPEQLLENLTTVLKAIQAAKPASLKGTYLQNLTLTTAMGPGVKLDISQALTQLQ